MIKKIEIPINILNDIYLKYKTGTSLRKLAKQHSYSFGFIQKQMMSFDFEKKIEINYPNKNGYHIVCKCKKTNKFFYDYKNKSGCLTEHLKKTYNDIIIPSNYIRKSIEYKNGKFWYDEYFYFLKIKNKERKKCKYCDWTTHDIENKAGSYEKHLKSIHNIDLDVYLKEYPDEKKYIKKEIYDDMVECCICKKHYKMITNTHLLKKHGITQLEYKIKHENLLISSETKEKLKNNYTTTLKNFSSLEFFIKENINITFEQSNRKILNGLEIDLLYNNIGFEINGNLYHTEIFGGKNKKYHLNKTLLAKDKNINLYHIFEDEIHYKPTIIIDKISHILGINNKEILHARKCIIYELNNPTYKSNFLNENHLQGNDKSNISLVAELNGEIVAMMCFNNKRHMNKTKDHDHTIYELTRFAVKNKYKINGIGSRILKFFIKKYNPKKIISFADIRWTPEKNNNLYTKLGFKLVNILDPDYYYYNSKFDRYKRFHKFSFGKKNIKKRFPKIYDDKKTEWEMMKEVGFDRIWDCGKYRYEINN
jgi:hypothetical protein